jgi:hypothetical protein
MFIRATPIHTAAAQWLEETVSDRRLKILTRDEYSLIRRKSGGEG